MANNRRVALRKQGSTRTTTTLAEQSHSPVCATIAAQGISTSEQFASFMSALLSDIIAGRITPSVANAACNAGGKLLKVVDLQHKYGTQGGGAARVLTLAPVTLVQKG